MPKIKTYVQTKVHVEIDVEFPFYRKIRDVHHSDYYNEDTYVKIEETRTITLVFRTGCGYPGDYEKTSILVGATSLENYGIAYLKGTADNMLTASEFKAKLAEALSDISLADLD